MHADECETAMKILTMFEMVGENLQDQVVFRLDSYEAAVPAGYHNSPWGQEVRENAGKIVYRQPISGLLDTSQKKEYQ